MQCPVITHDVLNTKIIIDFGDGCVGPYGRERRGKIIVTYSHDLVTASQQDHNI
jgi:hypothetical protein